MQKLRPDKPRGIFRSSHQTTREVSTFSSNGLPPTLLPACRCSRRRSGQNSSANTPLIRVPIPPARRGPHHRAQTEQVSRRVRQVINQFNRRRLIIESVLILRWVLTVAPVGDVKSNLKMLSHPNSGSFLKSTSLKRRSSRGLVPQVIQLRIPASPARCGCFIDVGEAARPASTRLIATKLSRPNQKQ